MKIEDLVNMENSEAVDWLIENQDKYELVEVGRDNESVSKYIKYLEGMIKYLYVQIDTFYPFPHHFNAGMISGAKEIHDKYLKEGMKISENQ